jgi:hypothetical protein
MEAPELRKAARSKPKESPASFKKSAEQKPASRK